MYLSACLICLHEEVRHGTDGEHPCLVNLIAVIADTEIDEDRFVLPDFFHACADRESGRQTQSAHGESDWLTMLPVRPLRTCQVYAS